MDGLNIYLSAQSWQNSLKSTIETKESMTKQEMTFIRNKRRRETFLLSHTRHICLEKIKKKEKRMVKYSHMRSNLVIVAI